MRRTLVLVAFVVAAAALAWVTTPPPRPTSQALARGSRLVRSTPRGIRSLDLAAGGRRVRAERSHGGWTLGGAPAPTGAADALEALARELATLRAVDAFRPASLAEVGLDAPAATIVVGTRRRAVRLAFGRLNAAGSTVYVRRGDEARVLQVGVYLLGVLERALDAPSP